MEIRSTEEARSNIEAYSKRLLNLLAEKKEIEESIKELNQEFKEEGVPVGVVRGAINRIKSDKKKTDSEKFESDTIKEWLESNPEIDNAISNLVAK